MNSSAAIFAFIYQKSATRPKRLFLVNRNDSPETKRFLEKFYMRLTLILNRLKPHEGEFAPKIIKILNAVVYKYGHAYKHHLFLRRARHSYSLAKKLSNDRIVPLIKQMASGLDSSRYEHNLTAESIEQLCAIILHRVCMLDKLRIVCAKNVDFSIGYVERRHNINLNLLFIALAAELGSLALKQIYVLVKTYAELSPHLVKFTQTIIPSPSALPVKSVIINEKNEVTEFPKDAAKSQDLKNFMSFINELDDSEDTLDEFELAKLEEIHRILRTRTSKVESAPPKKVVPQPIKNFYREVSTNQGKKKRKRKQK